ncbi:MAG: GGDEF domain-containing protein, partial [Microthrixaceae bacterium]
SAPTQQLPVVHVETDGVSEGLAGGDSVLEPDRDDAIGVMSAEFVDPVLEREFQLHHLDSTARRAISTSVVGASSCFVFTVSDFTRLGFGSHFVLLLALRSLVLLASVLFAMAVRRNPVRSLSWKFVSTLESAVLAVLFVVMAFRPEETEVNNLGISVTIIAMFLLVPNRFPAAFAISVATVVIDLGLAVTLVDSPLSRQIPSALTLVSFLVIGAMSANQLQRARREEFLSLRNARTSNDLLIEEIGRRRVLEDELTWMATHDALTDLLNRRAFYELAEREAVRARRTNLPVSILVIDADEFKAVNDRFGHHAGDEALRRIAATCRQHLRADDVVGRVGGEEFAVVMPGANSALAHHVAERLRVAVTEAPIDHPDGPINLSVSIGVTEYRVWHEAMLDAIQRADEAMYLAKTTGRNCVVPV